MIKTDAQSLQPALRSRAYYLDTAGNDHNDGTRDHPWKTIEKINSLQLNAGDSVLFKSLQHFSGTLRIDSVDTGTGYKPLIITSYGKGAAVIKAGNAAAVVIQKSKYIKVTNLVLSGSGRKEGNTEDGLSVVNCNNIQVRNLEITGFRNAGLLVYSSAFIRITEIRAHENGFAGLSISGEYQQKNGSHDIYIGYCKAYNNPGSPVILDNHSGNGILAGNCSKVTIEYCTATNNGWDMPRTGNGPVGIWCYEADSMVIQHCISYRNKTSTGGEDGGGFDLDGGVTNSLIQYCLSYENHGSAFGLFQYAGASPWHNNTIRYNISVNDGSTSAARAAVYVWNSSDDSTQLAGCYFYNNTLFNTTGPVIRYAGQAERSRFVFYNNIFAGSDSLLAGNAKSDHFNGNDWWSLEGKFNISGLSNLTEWSERTGKETMDGKFTGLSEDPAFLQATVPAITSTAQLRSFEGYKIPRKSRLGREGLDLRKVFRIETGGRDFNGLPAPLKGIGAAF